MPPLRIALPVLAFAILCSLAAVADPQVIWIEGEGEVSLSATSPENAHQLRSTMEKELPGWRFVSYQLHLLHEPVPADTVYVLAGPKRDLSDDGEARLRALINGGARILICIDPAIEHDKSDLPRLRGVLHSAGIEAGTDRLIDPENTRVLQALKVPKGAPVPRERTAFAALFHRAEHPLLKLLPADAEVIFADACRVAANSGPKDPFETQELFSTGADAFAEKVAGGRGPAGPVAVAAVQRGGRGRLFVVGDSTFLSNGFAEQTGRRDAPLAIAALKWLAEGIETPKPPATRKRGDEDLPEPEPLFLYLSITAAAVLFAGAAVFGSRK